MYLESDRWTDAHTYTYNISSLRVFPQHLIVY